MGLAVGGWALGWSSWVLVVGVLVDRCLPSCDSGPRLFLPPSWRPSLPPIKSFGVLAHLISSLGWAVFKLTGFASVKTRARTGVSATLPWKAHGSVRLFLLFELL